MATLATRIEKIEAQSNDIAKYTRIMGEAMPQSMMEDIDTSASLCTARDQLAKIACR